MPKQVITVTIQYKRDKKGGHPHIIVYYLGDDRISVGITHKKRNRGHNNYQLQINPLGGPEISYLHRHAEISNKSMFRGKARDGKLSKKDYRYVIYLANKKLNKSK